MSLPNELNRKLGFVGETAAGTKPPTQKGRRKVSWSIRCWRLCKVGQKTAIETSLFTSGDPGSISARIEAEGI